ncbi:MAG TPA: sigma 54-interacting transcriptional regulator [Firmicutes bacterium]|nr:sigma 54-interacting transcriptional regulator [Bacillota bacterium]
MQPRIGFLSASSLTVEKALSIASELKVDLVAKFINFENCYLEALKMIQSENAEVIIARGRTAARLKRSNNIPLLELNISAMDMLIALEKLDLKKNKIAIVKNKLGNYNFDNFIECLERIFNTGIKVIDYDNTENLISIYKEEKNKGVNTIVGGGYEVFLAKQNGLVGLEVLPSRETLIEILLYAQQVVSIKRQKEEELNWYRALFESISEGVVTINSSNVITDLNNKAADIFNIPKERAKGSDISAFVLNFEGLEKKGSMVTEVLDINANKYAVTYRPLEVRQEHVGAIITMEKTVDIQKLEQKIRKKISQKGLLAKATLEDIVGNSANILKTKGKACKYAVTEFNILITGETGVGKELFAQAIHNLSQRAQGPFVAVNCAALPGNLLESELFGYEEGAFTGAKKGGKAGLFELAHGGSIFLDEISSMSADLQAQLLRVIQEKEIMRIGGNSIIPVNVRIIAATNEPLAEMVEAESFRDDLFYRLNELNLFIPPLRARLEDIPALAKFFLAQYADESLLEKGSMEKYFAAVMDMINNNLKGYNWPGNIRQLQNFIKRCLVLMEELTAGLIPQEELIEEFINKKEFPGKSPENWEEQISVNIGTLAEMENELIEKIYKSNSYNKNQLAKILGVSRSTLWRKLNALEKSS